MSLFASLLAGYTALVFGTADTVRADTAALQSVGATVVQATTLPQAQQALGSGRIRFVVTDASAQSRALVDGIRAQPATAKIPVLLISPDLKSGMSFGPGADKSIRRGSDGTVDADRFGEAVQAALEAAGRR